MTENVLAKTLEWFQEAVREPTEKNLQVQVAVHMEEFHEMMTALNMQACSQSVHETSEAIKSGKLRYDVGSIDRLELLDAMCDQIVTAVGVAHMHGMDILGALNEVNKSNWSKFVDGKPVFNDQHKIVKGPNYFKPDLRKFV